MRQLILSLALVPSAIVPAGLNMCFYDAKIAAAIEAEAKHRAAQKQCLATMIYGEARGETKHGQVAVAYTAVNRAKKKSICKVVLAPYQYSVFNGNSKLISVAKNPGKTPKLKNEIDKKSWETALEIARKVVNRKVADPTNGSTHYLAPTVMKIKGYRYPKWSRQYKMVAVIDNHKFFVPYYPKKKNG